MKSKVVHDVVCITINTDASFDPETGAGGFAFWIVTDYFVIKKAGFFKDKTLNCNEAEVKCIANALSMLLKEDRLPTSKHLVINTDSKQGMQMIRKQTTEAGKKTHVIWRKVIQKIKSRVNKFAHVKAHTNNKNARSYVNNWCDEEAKKHMRIKRDLILKSLKNG